MSRESRRPAWKPLEWVGPTKREYGAFPDAVQDQFGADLLDVQFGDFPGRAKPLKGFGGAGVLELVADDTAGTYRVVYTVRFAEVVYVLHAFQKKSVAGVKTPRHVIDLVRDRLERAEGMYADWRAENPAEADD